MKQDSTLPLQDILEFTHKGVIEKIQKESNYSKEKAVEIFRDTLRYLYLSVVAEESISPTKMIDMGWHHFILFTKDYEDFCEKYLGQFVHHSPHTNEEKGHSSYIENSRKRAIRTIELAQKHLGQNLSPNWDFRSEDIVDACSTDCCTAIARCG